ncbi:hypothetical protein M433DRAFT_8179 [Acidomyces richmondensis BFW]|nr:MAG: hypothetical protein FE78DRAFT_29292 [Acidomyces sp. 'richmondensis']KYG41153.1 hypothetical protein M433DRAFT_8179 [Acidomyces richmondensis BFW]
MSLHRILPFVLAVVSAALPYGRKNGYVVHEKRASSGRWGRTDRVDTNATIPLRIGLTQTNLHLGYDLLMDVSHPSSANYGKFLSADEVYELFKPEQGVVDEVKDWLASEGVNTAEIVHSDNKGWLAIDLPAYHVEKLFMTEYYIYEHPEKELVSVGCQEYSVPVHLAEKIDYIRPCIKLSSPIRKAAPAKPKRSTEMGPPNRHRGPQSYNSQWSTWPKPPAHSGLPPDLQNCGVNITPPCIRALYDIPAGYLATPGYELGLYEQGSYYDASDVNAFFANFAPWVPQGTLPELKSIDGGEAPINCTNAGVCGEADIDVDLSTSLIYPQKVINFQVDDSYYAPREVALNNLFNTFLDALDGSYCNYTAYGITGDSPSIDPTYPDPHKGGYKGQLMCGVYTPTKVISISYGESEEGLPANYVRRQCNEFMKLGLQGHSIVVASSDYGVGAPPGDPPGSATGCLSNLTEGMNGTIFNPDYPADCPYVTAVGATMLPRNGTIYDKELTMYVPEVAPHFSSAGGFSNYYPMPGYQAAAVAEYFAKHDPGYPYYYANASGTNYGEGGGIYARGGRAMPDVSANGAWLNAIVAGSLGNWFGTSLAAPIFSSVLTLINEELAKVGKGPVGFVNPALYENPWVLNDITSGPNPNCGTDGFPAVQGWDPSTGLGTPNYPRMLDLFLHL